MKIKIPICIILLFLFITLSFAIEKNYKITDLQKLVPGQTSEGWWHKQVSTMPENRYMTSFQSLDYKGKLGWNNEDLSQGKIAIINAMELAQKWTSNNKPFGIQDWVIENVTYRFRTGENEIEYICSVTLRTSEYKTIEVIILPNNEIIPPVMNPEF
jgi:hypothetical protein